MNLNKTTEYSLSVLSFMAMDDQVVYSAEMLHQKLLIPRRYLRRLMTDLAANGFICSSKGRSGGFMLAKPPSEIHLSEIIEAMEGKQMMENCLLGHQRCNHEQACVMHATWMEAKMKMLEILSLTSLQSLHDKKLGKMVSSGEPE
ncbi:MAG: Rrf2 family transcriptional regulator [Marinilabiliales bacterium]|nr:Rrf2 family transcriptional regulator [Marinilabiliales bacterium]